MTEKEKQIDEMARCISTNRNACFSRKCEECALSTVCLYKEIATSLYMRGYRKQIEGEWIETVEHKTSLLKSSIRKEKIYCCPYCGRVYRKRMNYCGHCGAKMKGGDD